MTSAELHLRAFQPEDSALLLQLNEDSVHFLAPLAAPDLQRIAAQDGRIMMLESAGACVGFLIFYTDGSDYASPNYRWFSNALQQFLYIDRIVIDRQCRGRGLGQACYAQLQQWARERQLNWLAAEIDIEPANPGSLRFHQQQGFAELGRQSVQAGKKIVSLQALRLF